MIQLRPILESDAELLFPLIFKSVVTDTLVWDGPESLKEYREGLRVREEMMRDGGDLNYTMVDAAGVAVGSIGLVVDRFNRSATVGLWIGVPFHGLGYGSDAVRQMLELGFGEMRLERMEARVYVGNVASRRIFEKNGFVLEGTLRRVALKRGVFLDEWVMGRSERSIGAQNVWWGRERSLAAPSDLLRPWLLGYSLRNLFVQVNGMRGWMGAAVVMVCVSALRAQVPTTGPDAQFKAIYVADEAWRRAQPGNESAEEERRHLEPPHLPHADAATQALELAHWRGILAELSKIDVKALSKDERLNFEVYSAQIEVAKNAQVFKEYERPVNSDSQFWGEIAPLNGNEFVSEEHYVRYLSQLNDVPKFFAEQEANMRAGVARGFTPPRVTLEGRDKGLKDVVAATTPQETNFWKPFVTMPASMPASRQAELRAAAADVIANKVVPAYAKMLRYFDDEYVPHAVTALGAESVPDGKAYYQSKILEYATVTLTPDEIHAIGLKEIAGIRAEMVEQMKASGFTGTFPEFLRFLKSDPQFYAKTPQELLDHAAWIAKEFDNVASRYFGYEPRGRFGIVPVPPEMAPFYTAGRGGEKVYLVNTYNLPSRPLYSLPALTLHESAPGHSWQGAIADEQEREKRLPQFREAYISAYGEGWALYCERLGTEMGIYHTPFERFGMLSYQAWRAVRLVVDTGIHAQGWTREQAQQYMRENTALSDHEVETEVDRYISWPGQAVSYYLGEMSILKERRKAEAALGAKFNLRAFHDAVLETGSVPLPVLEEHIDAWIKGGGVGPYPDMEQ